MDELLARHRKEQKDLQGRITSKKKNATKKNRKGVNDECERLERELKDQQQLEVKAMNFDASSIQNGIAELDVDPKDNETSEDATDPPPQAGSVSTDMSVNTNANTNININGADSSSTSKSKKPSRQKARLARRAAEQEASVIAAAEEAANLPDMREQELKAMAEQMQRRGLTETMIRPDGHCLYSACASTISSSLLASYAGRSSTPASDYQTVRDAAASFISSHPGDFAPFLEEPVSSYVDKIQNTAEWGGHLELQAIARKYKITINVLRSQGQVEAIRPEGDDATDKRADSSEHEIWLAYYQHSFGLGEHYNALKRKTP